MFLGSLGGKWHLQTIKGVAGATPPLPGTDTEERLLIHISYSPRRYN